MIRIEAAPTAGVVGLLLMRGIILPMIVEMVQSDIVRFALLGVGGIVTYRL